MIAVLALVVVGLVVGGRGPTWYDWRARRRAMFPLRPRLFQELRNALAYRPQPLPALPAARVVYLPSACCRPTLYLPAGD